MTPIPRLVGMIHLGPLPGAPRFEGSMTKVVKAAVSDAAVLVDAGFPALMVENFGDAPFFADRVPPETIAGFTRAVVAIAAETDVVVGVNVLRNDALAALGIAAVTGARMIRVNVLTGTMYTDQGPIVGRSASVVRTRQTLCPDVELWADVMVKHATPPPGANIGQMAADTRFRGMADAIIVSGSGTGSAPDLHAASKVRSAVGEDTRLVIGSGASPENLPDLVTVADTVIVGSSLKVDGHATNRVDPGRAARFAEAARSVGLI